MVKKILVTGSKGFIGKHLLSELKRNSDFNIFEYDYDIGDLTKDPLNFDSIDHVFHLAARTFIPKSWDQPYDFYHVNIMGTNKVLEFCRKKNATLTYISAYVYGQPEVLPIPENHPLKPNNPYMHSKVIAESLCEFYYNNFGVNVSIIRPFNTYGPYQNNSFLIPHIITQLLNNDSEFIEIMDLNPRRDYLYVSDLVKAISLTLNTRSGCNIYNLGSGYSVSVNQILDELFKSAGVKKPVVIRKIIRKNEINDVVADISKIKGDLGWEPIISLEEGLKKTIQHIENSTKD